MNRTLTVVRGEDKAGAPRAYRGRWGASGRIDPACVVVAPKLGVSVRQAERRLHTCFEESAMYVEAFKALGDETRLQRHMGPLLKVYQDRTPPPLCPATWNLAQEADAAEDCAETAFHADASDANLDRLIRATDREILRQTARRDALHAEQCRREDRTR